MTDSKSVVQKILQKSTNFLRRVVVPVEGQGGVTLSYVCPQCHRYPLEDCNWWGSSKRGNKQCNWWCAACGGHYDWRNPNRVLIRQGSTDRHEAKVLRAHAPQHEIWDILTNVLKFLANQQLGGDSPVEVLVESLQERSRLKMTQELRRFIMVDCHEAVKIGDLVKNLESRSVVEPKCTADLPHATAREEADEPTLQR